MQLEIYPEMCCDYCNSVIHNHIDCPVCHKWYAKTDAYGEISGEEPGFELKCECGAVFVLKEAEGYIDEFEWEQRV